MKLNILSAYLSHTNEVVAIAPQSYFILNVKLDEDKANEIVKKINSIRVIDTEHWVEKK